uniref:Uncharacterized protein ycf35 n=1 Tax=Bostrychia tenella TaxID=324755 RepID=A0A1Z1M5Q9_9FLOR|nr:hypothetical protein [Bostrychia tenella]ARW61171.1 hypothetical protein [Bostrychia tenella]
MSHFSKVKTNISSLSVLRKTIQQLGFHYQIVSLATLDNLGKGSCNSSMPMDLIVYRSSLGERPLFSFVWNTSEYNLMIDLQLWDLDMDVNYFIDKLFQRYAYNIIVNQSTASGFQKINERIAMDGSVQLTVQKWSS